VTVLLCVTPNTALDRTLTLPHLTLGAVHRTQTVHQAAGGKGVNVARAARNLGADVIAAGLLAGHTGRLAAETAAREGLQAVWTWGQGETRCCTIIVDETGATVVNENGISVDAAVWAQFGVALRATARHADVICLCGSLPPGVTPEQYVELMRALVPLSKPVWVDTSGATLRAVLDVEGVHVKVNHEELRDALGIHAETTDALADAVLEVHQARGKTLVVTGGDGGVLMARDGQLYRAQPPQIRAVSAVGSGDSFMAGLVVALTNGEPSDVALRWAIAAGSANALSTGAGQFSRDEFDTLLPQVILL